MISHKKYYENRFKFFIIISICVLLVAYNFAIKKTIRLEAKNNQLSELTKIIKNAPERLKYMRNQDKYYSSFIIDNKMGANNRNLLMEKTSKYCSANKISLKEIPLASSEGINDYLIQTNKIRLSGNFVNLLQFVNYIEKEKTLGSVRSLRFYINRDPRVKDKELLLEIYLQSLTKAS